MTNPIVHAIVLMVAIIVPGGLLAYFAYVSLKKKHPAKPPTPDDAKAAFMEMYPRESLRARSRRNHLARARAFRRRKSEK